MEITEKDIFDFVFNPEILAGEKLQYLETQKSSFPQVKVFEEIKSSLEDNLSDSVKDKIASKIPAYKKAVVYELFSWTIEAKEYVNQTPVLAAASANESPQTLSKTFVDKEKNILIRLIGNTRSLKLFVFPVAGNALGEFSLTLKPGLQQYYFKDSHETKIIENVPDVQSISIELFPQ